ncbi:MAG: KH domain-containing protein [Myxococcaceae bacterium]|nr:KH domain-containing protein [Myxococcaceae bacterium]
MKDLIVFLAKALVDKPEVVELTVTPAADHSLYELKVAPDDIGKVIGRDGRTINALRTVVTHAAQKKGEKVRLELIDDRRPPQPNGNSAPQP